MYYSFFDNVITSYWVGLKRFPILWSMDVIKRRLRLSWRRHQRISSFRGLLINLRIIVTGRWMVSLRKRRKLKSWYKRWMRRLIIYGMFLKGSVMVSSFLPQDKVCEFAQVIKIFWQFYSIDVAATIIAWNWTRRRWVVVNPVAFKIDRNETSRKKDCKCISNIQYGWL